MTKKYVNKNNQVVFEVLNAYNQEVMSGQYNKDIILWMGFISKMSQKNVTKSYKIVHY